jgi:molybdopterin synthase catalytic subunit
MNLRFLQVMKLPLFLRLAEVDNFICQMKPILVTSLPLEVPLIQQKLESLANEEAVGAIVTFVGTVRNSTKGRKVTRLEFEAYEPMATLELSKIVEEAKSRWPLLGVYIHHRTGVLTIGEVPVVIGVCSAHRQAAFEAAQFCIDTLKQTVPIWKKEVFEDGEAWVTTTP